MPHFSTTRFSLTATLTFWALAALSADCAAAPLQLQPAAGLDEKSESDAPPTYVRAQRIEGDVDNRVVLTGDAEIRRAGSVLRGERITYTRKTDEVVAEGKATLARGGALFTGPKLRFKVDAHVGEMDDMEFSYGPRSLRGHGKKAEFLDEHVLRVTDGGCTACKAGDNSWMIRARTIDIDTEEETATGSWASLSLFDVPVLASPWFTFPVGDKRRSGILAPTFGVSSKLGVTVSVPYYWNIAPNYDYTVVPSLHTKRGVRLGNEFRYLEPNWNGTLAYDILPKDLETKHTRQSVKWVHNWASSSGLYFGANYRHVSDEDYLSDFSNNVIDSSESVLGQDFVFGMSRRFWNASLSVNKNQTLHENGVTYDKPYEQVPRLAVSTFLPDIGGGLQFSGIAEAIRFYHPDKVTGDRLRIEPTLQLPLRGSYWFLTPKVRYMANWYSLSKRYQGVYDKSSSLHLPISSIDAGLYFDRDLQVFGRDAIQTLEPRVYYAYVPYRNQEKIPLFEGSLANLSIPQLFTENIYTGNSRIASNNSITMALSSRVMDTSSGHEWLNATIGQRYYFSDPRISRDWSLASKQHSDYVGMLTVSPKDSLHFDVGARYSMVKGKLSYGVAGFRYKPRDNAVFGIYYRYNYQQVWDNETNNENLRQMDVTFQWPLGGRYWAVGRYNYSFLRKYDIEELAGIEYRADCWILRAVGQRYRTHSNDRNTAFFFQLELNGLGGLGSNPLPALQKGIPGYQPLTPVLNENGRYDYYE